MSKKRRDDTSSVFDSSDAEEAPVSMEVPAETSAVPEAAKPEPVMTFDRWFSSTGRPGHHKAGMLAFSGKVKGKRAAAAWAELFKAY